MQISLYQHAVNSHSAATQGGGASPLKYSLFIGKTDVSYTNRGQIMKNKNLANPRGQFEKKELFGPGMQSVRVTLKIRTSTRSNPGAASPGDLVHQSGRDRIRR